jgi:hypothetical protein
MERVRLGFYAWHLAVESGFLRNDIYLMKMPLCPQLRGSGGSVRLVLLFHLVYELIHIGIFKKKVQHTKDVNATASTYILERFVSIFLFSEGTVLGFFGENAEGPRLTQEPEHVVRFSNDTGTVIKCHASGEPTPTISWYRSDGSKVRSNFRPFDQSVLYTRFVRLDTFSCT